MRKFVLFIVWIVIFIGGGKIHAQSIDTTALHKIDSLSNVIESLQKSYSLFLIRYELESLDMKFQRLGNECSLHACELTNIHRYDLVIFHSYKSNYESSLELKDSLFKSWELFSNEYDYLNSYTFSSRKVVLETDYLNLLMIRRLFKKIPLTINTCRAGLESFKVALDNYSYR